MTSDVLLSRYCSLLTATLFQQHVRGFLTPSLNSRWEGLFFYMNFHCLQIIYNVILQSVQSCRNSLFIHAENLCDFMQGISIQSQKKNFQRLFLRMGQNPEQTGIFDFVQHCFNREHFHTVNIFRRCRCYDFLT